uniref:Uncharacterized protein n=1 Tax=Physcomitrium patens TaxID=3218 RepID=A0A7I3ZKL9_PHYPA
MPDIGFQRLRPPIQFRQLITPRACPILARGGMRTKSVGMRQDQLRATPFYQRLQHLQRFFFSTYSINVNYLAICHIILRNIPVQPPQWSFLHSRSLKLASYFPLENSLPFVDNAQTS